MRHGDDTTVLQRTGQRAGIVLLCCFLAAAAACDRGGQDRSSRQRLSIRNTADGIEVSSPDGSLHIAGNDKNAHIKIKNNEAGDIEMHYQKDSLAPGFPADIPLYAPAVVKMSQCFQGRNAVATLSATDNMSRVAQFYRDKLPEKGFALGEEVMLRELMLLQGTKDTLKLNISLKKDDAGTIINLALTENRP